MSNSPRTDAYMISHRFPSVFELAGLASEFENEVQSLRKEVEFLKHELSAKNNLIGDLEEQLYNFDSNERLSA